MRPGVEHRLTPDDDRRSCQPQVLERQQLGVRLEQLLQLGFIVRLHLLEHRGLTGRQGDDDLASHELNHATSPGAHRRVAGNARGPSLIDTLAPTQHSR